MNTTKKKSPSPPIKSSKPSKRTPAENLERYERAYNEKARKNKTKKAKFLYDNKEEADFYNDLPESDPVYFMKGMRAERDENTIEGMLGRRMDKIAAENWVNYELLEEFSIACLKNLKDKVKEMAMKHADEMKTFNKKLDVHYLMESHRVYREFPRVGEFTPLQIAAIINNMDVLITLLELRDTLKIPMENRPNPNIQDSYGNTTGHLLVGAVDNRGNFKWEYDINTKNIYKYLKMTKKYLKINIQNKDGNTIFHMIMQNILERLPVFKRELKNDDYVILLRSISKYKEKFTKYGLDFELKNAKQQTANQAYEEVRSYIQNIIDTNNENERKERKEKYEKKRREEEDDAKFWEEQRSKQQKEREEQQKKSNKTRKKSLSLSPASPLQEEPDPNCPSKGRKPQKCKTKKAYKEQTLIFHPDRNFGCVDRATHKFKQLQNLCEDKM